MFGHREEAVRLPDPSLPIPLGKVGIEVEVEGCTKLPILDLWESKEDHSLRNGGREFVTAGPMYGLNIRKALSGLFDSAVKLKWSEGYPRAGIHVHLDVRDLDFESNELSRLVSNYMLIEHAMFAYCGEWRRQTMYCDALEDSQADFKSLGRFLYSPPDSRDELIQLADGLSKYQALNFRPLISFGTIEFRALPTTFDFDRVFNWIRIILALKRSAQDATMDDPLRLLSSDGPIQYAQRILGETFPILANLIDPMKMWNAVDNASALMAFGNKFTSATGNGVAMGWEAPAFKPNPILEGMLAKKSKAATTRKPRVVKPPIR